MGKGNWRTIALAGTALVATATAALWVARRPHSSPEGVTAATDASGPSGNRGFLPIPAEPTFNEGGPPHPRDGGPAANGAATGGPTPIPTFMDSWRNAIINKDADTVVSLDQAFLADPARFRDALIESAKSDAEPRVRAFSTRVLGKFSDPNLAPVFAGLLADRSPYVRGNGAWALGELGANSAGRSAARPSMETLRRLQADDTSSDVRAAAAAAVKKLN